MSVYRDAMPKYVYYIRFSNTKTVLTVPPVYSYNTIKFVRFLKCNFKCIIATCGRKTSDDIRKVYKIIRVAEDKRIKKKKIK